MFTTNTYKNFNIKCKRNLNKKPIKNKNITGQIFLYFTWNLQKKSYTTLTVGIWYFSNFGGF